MEKINKSDIKDTFLQENYMMSSNYKYNYSGSSNTTAIAIDISKGPEDTISQLKFAHVSDKLLLFGSSWDGSLNAWKVDLNSKSSNLVATHRESKQAILRIATNENENLYYFGTTEGAVKKVSIGEQGQDSKFVVNELFKVPIQYPISGLAYCHEKKCLVVGAMDGTVYLYDAREKATPTAFLGTNNVFHLVGLDVGANKAFVCYTDMAMTTIDIRQNIGAPVGQDEYPKLAYTDETSKNGNESQITCVAAFPDDGGYMTGSITGKVVITSNGNQVKYDFHRRETERTIYSVNSVAISRKQTLGMSVGGDGTINYFNLGNGTRTSTTESTTTKTIHDPITACAVDDNAEYAAYATGSDWARGYEVHEHIYLAPKLFIKKITDTEKGLKKTTTYGSSTYGSFGSMRK